PRREVVSRGDRAAGGSGVRGVLVGVVDRFQRSCPHGGLHLGGIGVVGERVVASAVHIAVRIGGRKRGRVGGGKRRLREPERSEQSLLQLLGQWAAADLLGNETEQRVIRVAVLVGGVGRELRRVPEGDVQHLLRSPRLARVGVHDGRQSRIRR